MFSAQKTPSSPCKTKRSLAKCTASFIDVMCRLQLIIYGLDTASDSRISRCVVLITRSAYMSCFVALMFERAKKMSLQLRNMPSCSDFAVASIDVLCVFAFMFTLRVLFFQKALITKLLQPFETSGRHQLKSEILMTFLTVMHCLNYTVRVASETRNGGWLQGSRQLISNYVYNGEVAFMLLFFRLTSALLERNEDICRALSLNRSRFHWQEIVQRKWALRELTANMKNMCEVPLLMFFLKVFACIVHSIWLIATSEPDVKLFTVVVDHLIYCAQLMCLARQGNALILSCCNIELVIYYHASNQLKFREIRELRRVMLYRKHWDALTMPGGFALSTSTLASFFSSCLTSIVILMQFDYRVVQRLSSAVEIYSKNVSKSMQTLPRVN